VAFEGVRSGHEATYNTNDYVAFGNNPPTGLLAAEFAKPISNMHKVCLEVTKLIERTPENADQLLRNNIGVTQEQMGPNGVNGYKGFQMRDNALTFTEEEYTAVICRGSMATENLAVNEGYVITQRNSGHLGCIDSPECADRIWGTAGGQVYKAQPGRI